MEIDINILKLDDILNKEDYILKYLNLDYNTSLENKYHYQEDYLRKLGSLYFIKKYIGDDISYNYYGKPLSPNIYFNISHSGSYVIFSKSSYDIGIDIEEIKDYDIDILNYSMNKQEISKINNNQDFYKYWTLKESLLKCIGIGLNDDLKNINIDFGIYQYQNNIYSSTYLFYDNHVISLTIKHNEQININFLEETI